MHLKFMSNFDLTSTKPQTGTFTWIVEDKEYYLRFAAMESFNHKTGVIRILNIYDAFSIHDIIRSSSDCKIIQRLLMKEAGIVLFVGKTGSGKSTTLFHALSSIMTRHVYTIENPIERYHQEWIQIETQNIESSLTQLLRHDPDVIMIGEIRSQKEVEILIRAGLSGHFVVSTMHAGSINQSIRRMQDLGVSLYDIEEIVQGIVYQTLKRDQKGNVSVTYQIAQEDEIKRIVAKLSAKTEL